MMDPDYIYSQNEADDTEKMRVAIAAARERRQRAAAVVQRQAIQAATLEFLPRNDAARIEAAVTGLRHAAYVQATQAPPPVSQPALVGYAGPSGQPRPQIDSDDDSEPPYQVDSDSDEQQPAISRNDGPPQPQPQQQIDSDSNDDVESSGPGLPSQQQPATAGDDSAEDIDSSESTIVAVRPRRFLQRVQLPSDPIEDESSQD